MVNPKFAAEKPEAVKAFLRAFVKGLKETVANPSSSVDSVIKRNDVAKKATELERLQIALKDNILTPEVKQNGFGGIEEARLDKAIEQIGLTYKFKGEPPKAGDVFDSSFLPPAADRKVN
jgi:NitT/TauT family transport system substrate-binding protein